MNADAVYVNGLIHPGSVRSGDTGVTQTDPPTLNVRELTSIAVSGGRIAAVGSDREVLELVGPETAIFDLSGRRVIPGLIDGHMHAVRAGATWDQELHWTDITQLAVALESVRDSARSVPEGGWVRIVGGWHPSQLEEQRAPTRQELDEAAGDTPVYVQCLYEKAILNTAGLRAVGFDRLEGDPAGGEIERSSTGEPTGVVRGMGAFTLCLSSMGLRTTDEQRGSTATMMRQLHAKGLTGIVDPGGFGMPPRSYDAIADLWRRGELTMRMRLFASAVEAGKEFEQLNDWLLGGRDQFDGDMLRLMGIGEVVHYGCHDFEGLDTSFFISATDREELIVISRRTAECGWPMHIHAVLDSSIDVILDCWEVVDAEIPLRDLGFTVVHADAIGLRNIKRLAALGVGVVVDDHLIFRAEDSKGVWGEEVIRRAPPLNDLLNAGVSVAAGTDANRASSFNPWLVLWWFVTGRSLDGVKRRVTDQLMTREQALDAYTIGSARLSFEESERGHLHVGALADFAVLSADYFTIPIDEVPLIASVLTVVGGHHVHSSGVISAPSFDNVNDVQPADR